MKIVNFTPGLGNQIFEYVFGEYLKKKYPKDRIYGYYNSKVLNMKHNGLEVHRIFDIEIPPSTSFSNFMVFLIRGVSRIIPWLKATKVNDSEKALYFDGWWQNKKYFLDTVEKLYFREPQLCTQNALIAKSILNRNSVSIHIRRGDYLDPVFLKRGGYCSIEYYEHAMEIAKEKLANVHFYVFSNDIEWCKNNLPIRNVTFVTNNSGKNSYLDMYLMTLCKGNILANSSFSYWGARLNRQKNHFVIYPAKWFHTQTPDIFPLEWIGINGLK